MVVGGVPNSVNRSVELFDLSGSDLSCPKVAQIPNLSSGSVGAFLDDVALVCGGENEATGNPSAQCYTYNEIVSFISIQKNRVAYLIDWYIFRMIRGSPTVHC